MVLFGGESGECVVDRGFGEELGFVRLRGPPEASLSSSARFWFQSSPPSRSSYFWLTAVSNQPDLASDRPGPTPIQWTTSGSVPMQSPRARFLARTPRIGSAGGVMAPLRGQSTRSPWSHGRVASVFGITTVIVLPTCIPCTSFSKPGPGGVKPARPNAFFLIRASLKRLSLRNPLTFPSVSSAVSLMAACVLPLGHASSASLRPLQTQLLPILAHLRRKTRS